MIEILVRGCANFIGSNFVVYFLEKHENYKIINLDPLSYGGDLENLKEIESHPQYGDGKNIRDLCYATKLKAELGWLADEDFNSEIFKTLECYLEKYQK